MINKLNMNKLILFFSLCIFTNVIMAQNPVPVKPRILISTDIGGTDPDDNQSMIHFLMYSDLFDIEGLVSSPSYGDGNKEEILRTIDLYEKDLPKLKEHKQEFASPEYLRSITRQGRHGISPYKGYTTSTEGSDLIFKCAQKSDNRPLWILVWGGLEDLAQALYDAPEIQNKIKIYWIGGPNKKWSANSYTYIVENFPGLWFIEVNSSYYGFFSNNNVPDSIKSSNYYDRFINEAGYLGKDFKNYYNGEIKMGDTPSVLYMMDGNPENPMRESWGSSFEKFNHSPRVVFNGTTNLKDTVAFCSILEFHFKGPKANISPDSVCFWMEVPYGKSVQKWAGYYLGDGDYTIRYIPKKAEIVKYRFTSSIAEINGLEGSIVVDNLWPGKKHPTDYKLGQNWYTDRSDPELYDGILQGAKTVLKWRSDVLMDWAKRWNWLR